MYQIKKCVKCSEEKPLTEFYKTGKTIGCGFRSRCIVCSKEDRAIYCLNNKESRSEYQKRYQPIATAKQRERYRNIPSVRISRLLRARIYDAFKVGNIDKKFKARSGSALLGCTFVEYRKYLEDLFTDNMSWSDFESGRIHIDHIIPCSFFDLTNDEAQAKCFHYTNTRPAWKEENLKKSKRILLSDIDKLVGIEHLIRMERVNIIQQNVPN